MNQPELDLDCIPVAELDEYAPWPMPTGGPIKWPAPPPERAPRKFAAAEATGAVLASALLGMVKP